MTGLLTHTVLSMSSRGSGHWDEDEVEPTPPPPPSPAVTPIYLTDAEAYKLAAILIIGFLSTAVLGCQLILKFGLWLFKRRS